MLQRTFEKNSNFEENVLCEKCGGEFTQTLPRAGISESEQEKKGCQRNPFSECALLTSVSTTAMIL